MCIHAAWAMLAQQQGQNEHWEATATWRQVRTARDYCKFFGCLALLAALVCYAKDEGAFVTARPTARQTISGLSHSQYTHEHYISSLRSAMP